MGGKRGNGEGSVYQRESDGKWVGSLTLANGRRKVLYGKTRREVADKLAKALRDQQQGTLATGPRQTVKGYLDTWLETVARPRVKARTYLTYKTVVQHHLIPQLGKLTLEKLTPQHVSAMYRKLAGVLSARSVLHCHRILHGALKTAVRWGYLASNPCDLVDAPRARKFEIRPLNIEQAKALLAAASGERLEALWVLALTTGMREGELLGLKWEDVDLDAGAIQVRRAIIRIDGQGLVEQEPKSASARRLIYLAPLAVAALRGHRSIQLAERERAANEWRDQGRVFTNRVGGTLQPTDLGRQHLRPLLQRAGLPRIRFHDLRHSAASMMLALNVHPKIVQEQLGHSSISLTLDTYSHSIPSMHGEAARQLGLALSGGANQPPHDA